jgi:hypothetical protein
VDAAGDGLDQIAQETRRLHFSGAPDEADEGELAGAIDRYEEAQLAFFGADLGQVDMELADGIRGEALLGRLVSLAWGKRLMPCRSRQRWSVERVRCGMVGWRP